MNTLNEYLAMSYRMEIVEDPEEGGYVVSFSELPGCITVGETIESAVANAQDAKKAWLESAIEEGIDIREPVRQAKAMIAFNNMRRKAAMSGFMTDEEIEAEINAARNEE